MQKSQVIPVLAALLVGVAIGWSIRRPLPVQTSLAPTSQSPASSAHPQTEPAMPDEYAKLASVPANSPDYARAQRLLGWNYYAQQKHDWPEARKHVDAALAASPDDPKVLEDAGRVYYLSGNTDQGTALLKRAGTTVALEFLADHSAK